jgi:hypothetical protein
VGLGKIVIAAPARERHERGERAEQGLVQELVPKAAIEALHQGILDRLAGSSAQRRIAFEVSLVPLSLTIIRGLPRVGTAARADRYWQDKTILIQANEHRKKQSARQPRAHRDGVRLTRTPTDDSPRGNRRDPKIHSSSCDVPTCARVS